MTQPLGEFPRQLVPDPDFHDPKEWVMPIGEFQGTRLGDISSASLIGMLEWFGNVPRYSDTVSAIDAVLKERGGE